MSLRLKDKRILRPFLITNILLTALTCLLIVLFDLTWNTFDYKVSDYLYKTFVLEENRIPQSRQISLLHIDDSTYRQWGANYISRSRLADVNSILSGLSPEAVLYDLVFSQPSDEVHDSIFSTSINNAGNVYLPAAFRLSNHKKSFGWQQGIYYERLQDEFLTTLKTGSDGSPRYADVCVPQYDMFAEAMYNSGHIALSPDNDGIFRHCPLVIKVDSLFFPMVTLAMFLDYERVPFDSVVIEWGESLIIPPVEGSYLDEPLKIPIDNNGEMYVPFPYRFEDIPKSMAVHNLSAFAADPRYYDELSDFFEGNFVIVGDISSGISDVAHISIEENVPLIIVHAAIMNAFLTKTFFSEWDGSSAVFFILIIGVLFGLSVLPKSNVPFYLTAVLLALFFLFLLYFEISNNRLIPAVTIAGASALIFLGSLAVLEFLIYNQYRFEQRLNILLADKNKKILEQQEILERQSENISRANLQLQEKNSQLEELNREKDEFLGIAAHDLKNPLAGIILTTSMIQRYFDKMKPPDMKKKITVIEETADRMRGIVMNLLDINALESGSKNIRKQFFDITNVIRGSVEELEAAAKEKNIIIRSKGIEKEVLVYSDSDSVRMILDNLISNAVKFSPKDTEVTVTLSAEKGKAYISVKDDGPGLSDEDKNKLFGKFARLSAQPTGGENSTGLGLSIVKKLTDMIGGDILCESRQGSGAVFILKLPLDT